MFGLSSEIEFEPTGHNGLWEEEAACSILVFDAVGVRAYFRFSVAIEAGVAKDLEPDALRDRLREELGEDLDRRLPTLLGVPELGTVAWFRAPSDFVWCEDSLRRLGYHSLAPHGMKRLGDEQPDDVTQCWRRTLR